MTCTIYDDSISYDDPILYDGICTSPPAPTGNPRGGVLPVIYNEADDPRKRRKDEEILFL